MRVLRLLLPGLTICIALASCGTSGTSTRPTSTPGTVAMVGSATISRDTIRQYMSYAMRFYSWMDATQVGDGASSCSTRSTSKACVTLRRQVLRRLVEERIVATYAARHGIRLSHSDANRVQHELIRLQSPRSGTAKLFTTEHISPAFMRNVLRNQLLVKHVEAAVMGQAALSGPSFHLQKYVFPTDRQSYRSAIDLATGGVNVLSGHAPPTHWVAAYRLPAHVRALLGVAGNGDYVGPTLEGPSYTVYKVLGRGNHRYGLPARQEIVARSFQNWLRQRLAKLHPKCLLGNGRAAPCSGFDH